MEPYQITLLTKEEADKDAVKELIAKVGGEVKDERPLGQKPLAYPIKKERVAYFALLRFTMEPEQVLTLNNELLLSGRLLRHMITTAPAKPVRAPDLAKMPVESPRVAEAKAATPALTEAPKPEKPAKKTKAQLKVEAAAVKERQKKIEEELAKILREE